MSKVSIGMAFLGAFRWCVTDNIRFTSKSSCFITVFDEVMTVTGMASSKFTGFVILTSVNVMNFMP